MILLVTTTDKLQIITSAAITLDVHCSYAEYNSSTFVINGLGKQNTAITTAATTDILAAPAASTVRNLKQMTARNKHATLAGDVTVQFNQNGTLFELVKVTLLAGEQLEFVEGVGFFIVTNISASRLLTNAESSDNQRVFASFLGRATLGTLLTISGTAYYVYVGRIAQAITAQFVEFQVTTVAAGAQTAEVGLFSTPAAPSKSAQTLTKIVATGTVDSVTSTGMKRNTTTFSQLIAAGTHLWAAARFAMATTQPTCNGLTGDYSQGHILTTTGGGALTGLTTAAGTIPAIGITAVAPELRVTLD